MLPRCAAAVVAVLLCAQTVGRVGAARIPRMRERVASWKGPRKDADTVWVETLSWEPRAFLYHNFLTLQECEHIIGLGRPTLAKSTVIDNETGRSVDSRIRTSKGTFLQREHDEVVAGVERRIARFSKIPAENGEALQILHYEPSQKYEPHFDYFHDPVNALNGGQRLATMLMYLSDVEEGGETVFPSTAEKPNVGNPSYSTCAQQGIATKPRTGDALLFFSQTPNGTLDTLSLHSGCPVIRGQKFSATKWMRSSEFAV